jgi:predicted MFS family arabinose efflux permease
MLTPYLRIFRVPGSRSFVAAGFISRLSMSMINLATVLMISQRTGQYAVAGFLVAVSSLIFAFASPRWSGLADRRGQSWVLRHATPIYLVALVAFVALVQADAPEWTWFVAFGTSSLCGVQTGSMVRRRWHYLLGEDKEALHTAWSLESVLDEVIFIIGPVLATVLATQVHPAAGLIAVIVFVATGTAWLYRLRASEPAIQRHEDDHRAGTLLRIPGMPAVLLAFFFLGGYFVAIDLLTIAYMDELDHRSLTGVVLACWALGSGLSGVVFGAIRWRNTPTTRLLYSTLALALLTLPMLTVDAIWAFTIVLFISGWAISPSIISGYAIVERLVIDSRVTEAISWSITGIVIGSAAMAAVAGRVIDMWGARRSFILAVAPPVLTVLIVLASRARLEAHTRTASPS